MSDVFDVVPLMLSGSFLVGRFLLDACFSRILSCDVFFSEILISVINQFITSYIEGVTSYIDDFDLVRLMLEDKIFPNNFTHRKDFGCSVIFVMLS